MPDIGQVLEYGLAGLALLAVIMLIDFIRKHFRQTPNGDRRTMPHIVECPNRIEGLDATLREVAKQSGAQTKLITEQLRLISHNGEGIDRLVDQHKPGIDGRENWKIPPRMERLQEESRDLLKEIVVAVKRNGSRGGN